MRNCILTRERSKEIPTNPRKDGVKNDTRNKSGRIHYSHRGNEHDPETASAAATKYVGRMARPMGADENYAAVSASLDHKPNEDTKTTG